MPQPKEPGAEPQAAQSPDAQLKQQLYPAPRQSAAAPSPKALALEVLKRGLSPQRLVPAGRLGLGQTVKHLPPLEGRLADAAGPSQHLGSKLPETPLSPRASLSPLQLKSGLAATPAPRGSIAAARKLSVNVALEGGPTGLGSPQLKSATGPLTAHRDSCLVLPNSPMAPAAAALASPPVWQAQSVTRTTTSRTVTPKAAQGQAEVGSSAASPALPSPQEPAQQQQQQQPQAVSPKQALSVDYNYIKLIFTLREYPTTEDFVYLRRFTRWPADCNPYALEVVQFADINQANYYTMSVRGITHYINGVNAEFASLEQWEQEVKLYVALKQLRLFKQHKLWKAFKCWKSAIHSSKLSDAKSVLNKQLFLLSPVFQKPLQQFHALCHELSGMRLHSIQQGQVYSLMQFAEQHAQQVQECAQRLAQFSEAAFDIVHEACRDDLVALQQHLGTFSVRADGNAPAAAGSGHPKLPEVPAAAAVSRGQISVSELLKSRSTSKQLKAATACATGSSKPADSKSAQEEYAYTMAAAYRSEQRRLLSFLRMADFIMCDTLQTVLVQSVSEMLAALEPSAYTTALAEQGQQALDAGRSASGSGAISAFSSSSGGRSLQAMYTMVNSSRRQRASLAVAGMQQKPVTATQQSAAAEAAVAAAAAVGSTEQKHAGQRQPLFELDVVMSSSCDELSFVPEPEQFQAQLGTVLSNFISCATGITRLARPALLTGLLGAKQSEVQEFTPLADLVVPPECRELVTAAKAALEVALARATQQRSAYEPYRDMAQYDHQLDLASLAPAYKATCAMAAKALTEAAPATAEPSLVSLTAGPSTAVLPAAEVEGQVTLATFKQLLDRLLKQKADIDDLLPSSGIDLMRLKVSGLKQALLPWPLKRLAELQEALPVLAADMLHDFISSVQSAQSKLSAMCTCVEEYVEKMLFLDEYVAREKALDAACNQVHALYALLDEYSIKVPDVDRAGYATMDSSYAALKALVEEVEGNKDASINNYSAELEAGAEGISKEVAQLREATQNEMLLDEGSSPAAVLDELQHLLAQLKGHEDEVARINKYQQLFKVAESRLEEIATVKEELELKQLLWSSQAAFDQLTMEWRSCHFDSLNVAAMEEAVAQYHKAVSRMERGLTPNKIVPKLRAAVDEYRLLHPVVAAMRNAALKERHWAKVFASIGTVLQRVETFTLQVLLDAKVGAVKDAIIATSTEATQEASLEDLLAKVVAKWADIELSVIPYKDSKDIYILGSIDNIQVALEDSLVTMSTILASRFVAGIRGEVEKVERQLNTFTDTLEQWVQVQKAWMYLEPIFSAQDIQKQLPAEHKAFEAVHKQLRDIMRLTRDRPNALQTASNTSLLEKLSKNFSTLESIQKSLEEYLETKRVAFPRFYFLSNDELLEILAQSKNAQAVQPHMSKCFDGIRRLDFGDDPKGTEIFAMVSGEGERVSFGKNTVKARNSVESWLGSVESAMVSSLRRLAKHGMASYVEEPRAEWVLQQPAQLVIAVSQAYWCGAVEAALKSGTPVQKLADVHETSVQQVGELTRLVRGDVSTLARRLLAALITIDVHSRDIVSDLLSKGTSSTDEFEWQMQLRYYWEDDDLIVRQVKACFQYAYEYLGAQPRLVVTPMTDRCYLTLTGALHLKLGGAPAGPAGTGKTETIKDLGKALGVNCVVFNCGDNLDYKFMGKFFSGLAQCGAWACFDEFNRIDVEVLSVVAQQLLTIQNALKANLDKCWFEGRPIKLQQTCGVFITMNPGYAGRTELPDNLKALFRPMAMMIPDYALVAEVMLFSEGFEDSKVLSRKMVQLYKLASEQLSQQDHYDFGMRALKSVLVMAGSLKRANPDLQEDIVLIRAMRDSNLPKFLVADVELFSNIIGDLFPGVQVPDQDYGELEQSLRAVLQQRGLQQAPGFLKKAVQMWDTMCVRFGLMLVGPTGSGKTTCGSALQGALTRLRRDLHHPNDQFQVTHTYTLNPKCINMGELYGEYNLLTNEWTDGLASSIIRTAVADTTLDRKWVVFDGPVDAVWIENMNTVLDDNCTLCLPNGERIKLNPLTMRMVFEVQDLAAASPATVSRCGMVYVAREELGWRPAIQTWLATALPQAVPSLTTEQRDIMYSLFDANVDAGLAWLRKHGSEYVSSVDNNLTTSLAMIMQSLLDPSKGFKAAGMAEDVFKQAISRIFAFAYIWGLGGNLAPAARPVFDEHVREQLQDVVNIPGGGVVYDYQLVFASGKPEFKQWSENVPTFSYNKAVPYFQMVVPTADTVRFSYLLETCLDVGRSVLLTGITGVGKSVIAGAALQSLAAKSGSLLGDAPSSRVAGRLLAHTIMFSAKTSSNDVQSAIESKLDKKRKKRYGAPPNMKVVFFIDDVNMPARERYGAQPPIELLRQFQDFRGMYDRKQLFWRDIEDVMLCAACGPPGGGRQEVSSRFFRHFTMLAIPPPSDSVTKTILSSIVNGFLAEFNPEVRSLSGPVVLASIDAYNRISEELLPTPAKSHYTFNLRDLSKQFQGILMATPSTCNSKESLARLWLHEACRVFADRLVCDEDRQQLHKMLVELASKHNLGNLSYADAFEERNIAWVSFLKPGLDRPQRRYEEVSDWGKVQKLLKDYLDDYNSSHTNTLDLVFFQAAVDHVCRLCRVLQQPRGNAMLVGVGGSGKQSLTRFAAHISGCKVVRVELSRNYGLTEFRADLVKLYRTAGVDNEQVVFLFSDTSIVQESFLEDINNMLNSGEVPGLFAPTELEQIVNDVREWVEASGLNPSREGCYSAFINRVRDNLHIVLTMSPVSDAFRSRCRQFPSLINCCTIDWFSDWPDAALLSVSKKFLASTDLGGEVVTEAVAQTCLHIHRSVEEASGRFFAELRRRFYTTPKSYLDLISLYLQLLQERKSKLQFSCERLLNGVNKLTETEALVTSMKADLARLQPVLEAKAAATADLLVKVSADQQEAEKVKVVVAAEEQEIGVMQQQTQDMADEAKADLAEALPALQAAVDSLNALNKNDIVEIKSFTKPPALVQMTMEAVCILKQEKPDWDTAKRVLSDTNFMRSLVEFDKDNISDTVIHKLKKYIDNPDYQPNVVAKQSRAAMSLCMWTRAMDVYNRISKVVEPKRKKLAEAEAKLEAANSQLKAKQDALAAVVQRVSALKQQLADAESEQRQLSAQAELTRKRLERANKLTSGLSEEGVRWRATAEQLQMQIGLLVGDVFISAACIAYYGAFTGSFREKLIRGWVAKCKELGIPVSKTVTLCGTLADPVEVREWMLAGLPSDGTSIDNGILVTRGKRWPLMIDPQGQASGWVKALEGRNGLKVIKLSDPNFLRTLENCIRIGSPCLIEDVGEALDPALEPVLQRSTFKQGGRTLIRLGDSDVDYDLAFKLYITTKQANPHYFPETCIKVTLINFTVTMQGLEDQLLAEVVRLERPELEEQRDRLVVSIAAYKRQLQELEDKILKLLRESEGNILDDEQLLNTLNNSKRTSADIQMRVKEAEETECDINTVRERYRPAATRGSILYFTIADLAGINPMYQFSLAYFTRMFSQCITDSTKSDDVATRLRLLSDHTTSFVFKSVSRGLFEEHKRLFSFLLCTSILRHQPTDSIPEMEWSCLIRGPVTTLACQQGASSSSHDRPRPQQLEWLPEQGWTGLQALEQCLPQLQGLVDSWQQQADAWKQWHGCSEPHQQLMPDPWRQRLSGSFAQLLLIHLLRQESFVPAAHQYVSHHLGKQFTEPEPWTLDEVFEETSAKAPIIFILTTGADPTSMLQRFGERKGWQLGGRLQVVSLGQGQGVLAETVIKQAAVTGDWVCLQNCHLAASWMRRLEGQVEDLAHGTISGQPVHPDFRLWLTSMPSPVFPVPVLQNGIKLTNEPPKGVKANLARSYNQLSPEVLDRCPGKPNEWRRLLFSLTMFHAVLQERRRFGSLGFNIRYEFNTSDLECSSSTLNMFLSSQDTIPWEALEYVIGQVNYGGRVTDDLDRRCLMSVLRRFISPRVVRQECAALTASGTYSVPKDGSIQSYLDAIRAMPSTESPEVFGMHPNANIAFQLQETSNLLDAVISTQPRVSSSGNGSGSTDAIVAALCADILQNMPEDLSMDEATPGLFDRNSTDGKLNSLSVILGQEVERFTRLSGVMRSSLAQLQAAIKGLVVMSQPLEAAYNALLLNEVPEVWAQVGYPSLKPLAAWIKDYTARIAFMRLWLRQGPPACFWLPGFFFPQGFLTGMLQVHARKYALPIDSLSYSFQVTDKLTAADVTGPPEDGIYVDGLWLEGARWDAEAGCLAESQPGVMSAPLPIVHFKPAINYTQPADEYQCPLYKTSARAGVLSTTGCSTNFVLCVSLPCPAGKDVDAWVLQGVALLCQLDS